MTNEQTKRRTKKPRVAVVTGLRTPFVKSSTVFKGLSAIDLGKAVVAELLYRSDLDTAELDRVVYGQVVINPQTPNIAREVVLGTDLPRTVDAYSVSRACATSTQAVVDGSMAILTGDAKVVIAGGADSLSRPPITYQDHFVDVLMQANAAREPLAKAKAFLDLKPKDLLPKPPGIKEMATGETMGESAEKMAKLNGISRADQDALALRSHERAAAAWNNGTFADEVMAVPIPPAYDTVARRDGLVRSDTSLEKLAQLKPVFDRNHGSITAGNSSPLTDGASAVILMREDVATALGYEPLAFVRAWAFAACDPGWQLLMGPAFAAPRALARARLALEDIDVVDMHEAFAAQVLSNLRAFESAAFAAEHLGLPQAVGTVVPEKFNLYGGSISIGHPFAATGTRQVLTVARELARRGSGTALITQCAAGGLGAALVLER